MKTVWHQAILKDELLEKVHLKNKEAIKDVSKAISIYNHQRPHGSIDYLTSFEAHFKEGKIIIRKRKT